MKPSTIIVGSLAELKYRLRAGKQNPAKYSGMLDIANMPNDFLTKHAAELAPWLSNVIRYVFLTGGIPITKPTGTALAKEYIEHSAKWNLPAFLKLAARREQKDRQRKNPAGEQFRTFWPAEPTESFIFYREKPFFDNGHKENARALFIVHDQLARTLTSYKNKGQLAEVVSITYYNRAGELYKHEMDTPAPIHPHPDTISMMLGSFRINNIQTGIEG